MRLQFFLPIVLLSIIHSGCIPNAPQLIEAYRSPQFRPDASFKVVSLNSADPVLAVIEQELLTQGFKVIADNYLRTPYATTGNVTVTTADTTYNTTQYRPAGMEIFKDKTSDYIVRYSMAWRIQDRFFDYFNASVINTASGAVEFTYNFRQATYAVDQRKDMNAVVRDFAVRLHSRQ